MKVETPQILWNSEGDKGKNAPLYSLDMLESGISSDSMEKYGNVLVTAGNTNIINMWKVSFGESTSDDTIFQKQQKPLNNQIAYMTSLTRHELPVNTVAFSPDGLHLVTAGEAGNIVLWSVPVSKRGNGNGRHFWSTITKESDLSVRIVSTHAEGVCDISWSSDSKRFVVGTIDSLVLVYEDKHYANNQCNPETHQKESEWQLVFRNGEHSSFVQGVSYDPSGVYLASMGSDRTVRVFPRKTPPKSKKKVLRPSNSPRTVTPPQEHQRMVSRLLTESKMEYGKTKRIKQRTVRVEEDGTQVKQRLYADESTCESFFRRLSWTVDGAYLITPAALWHQDDSSVSFSTYLFARHKFDEPCRVLLGLEKPSVVVRPNPVLFQLPSKDSEDCKENQSPRASLPYRSIFAVLTLDSILIYDTHHYRPLSVIRGLHYAGLTDCCWSRDGMNLLVCSTDGYLSIINFANGELGEVYETPQVRVESPKQEEIRLVAPEELPPIPPCQPGQTTTLTAPPAKRAKKTRITPTLISVTSTEAAVTPSAENKRSICTETESVGAAVTKLSLSSEKPKKKKRIQPLLIAS